jgi:glycosyltransferase involved in cell wall biosynthesis
MSLLSVVVALYNEEDNIEPLFAKLREALKGMDYELVMVDDGSKDKTIEKVKQNLGNDTKLVTLMKNYGQSAAMAAGIQAAEGEYIATMDGDLQNDPDDIPMMLKKITGRRMGPCGRHPPEKAGRDVASENSQQDRQCFDPAEYQGEIA